MHEVIKRSGWFDVSAVDVDSVLKLLGVGSAVHLEGIYVETRQVHQTGHDALVVWITTHIRGITS